MDKSALIEAICNLTLLEAAEIVKELEDKLGVSAAAPAEEKTSFDVELTAFGEKKLDVIKVIRKITGLGLKESKELVEGAPSMVKEGISKEDAEAIKKELTEVGATITIK
ncbi:50S ribosomal protein L7/L12 [bacterium]|nr:50S ribosomal protein L7/L12 [bacterium]